MNTGKGGELVCVSPSSPAPPAAWAGSPPARSPPGTPTFRRGLGLSPGGRSGWRQLAVPAAPARCARVLPLDLTRPPAPLDALRDLLARDRSATVVRWLVCAAGVWAKWAGIDAAWPRQDSPGDGRRRIPPGRRGGDRACACPHLARGSRVLELCSTAAFQPLPGLGVYAATKAFLQSYTEGAPPRAAPPGGSTSPPSAPTG